MARKITGYTELQWTCPACGHKNLGTATICSSCAAPQPDDVVFEQPAHEELSTDEKLIQRAKAGPDIHCAYCGTRNPATAAVCSQCGADISEGSARRSGEIVGAHRHQAAPDVVCPYCGTKNAADALACSNCKAALPSAAPQAPKIEPQSSQKAKRRGVNPLLIGIILVVCIGAVVLAVLFTRTEEVGARVESVHWQRTVAIEQLGPVRHEEWLDEIPNDAEVGSCSERVHHVQSDPAPNSDEVCGTPYTVDTGTGVGEVVQDCEYQVYQQWCQYTVQEWQEVDVLLTSGDGFNPAWPELSLASGQREGERSEGYRVIFNSDGERLTYDVANMTRYNQFDIGSEWILEVNTFNDVVAVEPAQ